jgi:hypothetical protein
MGTDPIYRSFAKNKWGLSPFIFLALALPARAAFDANEITLGATEKQIRQRYPQANCRPLEWPTHAADRRCDDSRVRLDNINAAVTFYLKKDSVEGFDVRFEKSAEPAMRKFLLARYGTPVTETEATVEWKARGERARLTVEESRRRASLFVWRGTFEDEIYKVR